MTGEKIFENKVKRFLDSEGAWYIKYWAGAQYTKTGIPDILACINGTFYGIEVKAMNGKPSLLQLVNLRNIRQAGGVGVLLYPDEFDRFVEFVHGSELGKYWYRDNKKKQQHMLEKMTL